MSNKLSSLLSDFYSGLSGLQLPIPKYLFPEAYRNSTRLTYYASFFNSIEINSTFYKLPMPKTVSKWASEVPENFKFTFKLWKGITHTPELNFKEPDVELFFKVIAQVAHKKGCVLIQFPPSMGRTNMMQLDLLLGCVRKYNINQEWKIAVEFRNKSWYHPDVYNLLESHQAALVVQDIPKTLTPMIDHASDFMYIRFHGPTGNYRDSYEMHFLAEYATYVREWLEEGKAVFVYFNNTMGDAFKNLETLNRFIYNAGEH
jgi:uncharacterized protein YecE (DUF72 family)